MIRFALKCPQGHQFESWFQSSEAFDKLKARGLVACTECGDAQVEKALMAPAVKLAPEATAPAERPLATPASEIEAKLKEMKTHLEQNSEYVGMNFATEARKMHAGNAPERAIWGEAKPAEAKKLIEDGVPVAPLPFLPTRKSN
ncbi:MAG: DUF1178 family protein [Rhodobacteraceae bacterium]|nr:DUF1178 family protein [Paracoccaceae bacterium]